MITAPSCDGAPSGGMRSSKILRRFASSQIARRNSGRFGASSGGVRVANAGRIASNRSWEVGPASACENA